MIKLLDGADNWKFIDMSESSVAEAFYYIEKSSEKLSFFLDANKCSENILNEIAKHKKLDLLTAMHLLNEWGNISILENFTQLHLIMSQLPNRQRSQLSKHDQRFFAENGHGYQRNLVSKRIVACKVHEGLRDRGAMRAGVGDGKMAPRI